MNVIWFLIFIFHFQVDREKCIKMALTHDLCEAIAGDVTPLCGVSSEEKHEQERLAMIVGTTLVSSERLKSLVSNEELSLHSFRVKIWSTLVSSVFLGN